MPSNTPFGFRPMRHLSGGDANRNMEFPIATGYATAIGTGDIVKLLNDGTIAVAAAGDRPLGVFMGVSYTASDGSQVFTNRWPASTTATNIKASVMADPMVTCEVMSGGTPTLADAGQIADHVTGTPNAVTGNSTAYLNSSTGTGTAGFRILRLVDKPGNSGQYATLEVQFQEHEFLQTVGATPGI